MNQQSFASFTGIGSASLSSIFTGRTRPTLNHVDAIIDKFPNVNPMWLLKGAGGMFLTADDIASPTQPTSTNQSEPSSPDLFAGGSTADLFSSANMTDSAMPSNNHAATLNIQQPTTHGTRNTQPSFLQQAPQPVTPPRKITEIRIFYDDQTWESFVPKK